MYLIFPINGLLPTHIRSLNYLLSKGLSVTVVSNVPLSSTDEEKLLTLCHCYIERPNFGYDFGGYRDGILALEQTLSQTKQLVLINDSVWFPVSSQTDWLEDIDSLNVDFSGAVSNYGMPRVEAENFRDLNFDYHTDHKNFHYCSFALSFGENILHYPGFVRFWKHFPLTSKKKRTVRRGEIGLTAWVLKHGFTHGETLGVAHLNDYLDSLSDDRLAEIASKVIIPEDARLKAVKKELLSQIDTLSRKELTGFILTAAARQGAGYALAYFSIFELGYPFLKKSPLWLDRESSDISLWLLEKLGTPASQDALKEATMLQKRI
ncbi:rhamnan synthesis F family protein [Roseobacter sp.]|uniref:rhamnan synthesis F family protein n=1 Tax=Roseobacter sp. TaxID=1907202 RepID=UPI00385DBB83